MFQPVEVYEFVYEFQFLIGSLIIGKYDARPSDIRFVSIPHR